MKRDRNERPSFRTCLLEAWVFQCLTDQRAETAREVDFSPVFEMMDEVERTGISSQDGTCEFKGEAHVRAVLATEGGIDAAVVAFAAGRAEWGT